MKKDVTAEKAKSKSKVMKIVLGVIGIIILIILLYILRNFIIILNLQKNITQYSNSTNYHMKVIAIEDDGATTLTDYYTKDGKQVAIMNRTKNNSVTKMSIYNNGEKSDTFIETPNSKIAELDNGTMSVSISNGLKTDNNWQTFLASALIRIKSVNYNGKRCYIVNNINNKDQIYIEKDTGLLVKSIMNGISTAEKTYEFNNVDDSIFIEPDISQYKLQKSSQQ